MIKVCFLSLHTSDLSLIFPIGLLLWIPGSSIALKQTVGLFRFGLALIFENTVHIFLSMQRHADFPRLAENLRILNRDFVLDRVRIEHGVSLGEMERVAVKVSGHVEPCLVVLIRNLDNQGIAFPVAAGIA